MSFKNIFFLLAITCLFSCQKEINFDASSLTDKEQLFIEGILYVGEVPKIYVSNSVGFFNKKVTPQDIFARDVEVFLTADSRMIQLQADSTFDSFRCRWLPYYSHQDEIEWGKTYELMVKQNDKTITASTTIDQAKVELDSVIYIAEFVDVYGGHDGVILYFDDAEGEDNYYRFQMDRWQDNSRLHVHVLEVLTNTCTEAGELFYTRDLGRTIHGDGGIDGKKMNFNAEVSFEYIIGDETTVYLQSLDPQSAAFFKDIDEQLQSILNPFVEPTFINSTIEGAIGVFGSAVRSDPVTFIYPVSSS